MALHNVGKVKIKFLVACDSRWVDGNESPLGFKTPKVNAGSASSGFVQKIADLSSEQLVVSTDSVSSQVSPFGQQSQIGYSIAVLQSPPSGIVEEIAPTFVIQDRSGEFVGQGNAWTYDEALRQANTVQPISPTMADPKFTNVQQAQIPVVIDPSEMVNGMVGPEASRIDLPAAQLRGMMQAVWAKVADDIRENFKPTVGDPVIDSTFDGSRYNVTVKKSLNLGFTDFVIVEHTYDMTWNDSTRQVGILGGGGSETGDACVNAAQQAQIAYDRKLAEYLHLYDQGLRNKTVEAALVVRPEATQAECLGEFKAIFDSWWSATQTIVRKLLANAPTLDKSTADAIAASGLDAPTFWEQAKASTASAISGIADSSLWTKLGDTLTGAASWAGETVKEWGPTGLLAGYAGYKAVNAVDNGPNLIKYGLIGLGVYLVLK